MTGASPDLPGRREFLHTTAGAMAAFTLPSSIGELGALARGHAPLNVGLVGAGRQGRAILQECAKIGIWSNTSFGCRVRGVR